MREKCDGGLVDLTSFGVLCKVMSRLFCFLLSCSVRFGSLLFGSVFSPLSSLFPDVLYCLS